MGKPTIDQLRDQVRATVITAQDLGYDEARAVRNGMFDKNPKAVICAEQVADVIAAVNFARDAGLELAVRGGGHSAPGFGTTDGGVVLDLSLMRGVHVGSQTATARAGGGATWGDFNCATHAFGLATTGGISSTTGVGGLTLGGGIGYLARPYGLSIDNLRSAEVVTADGRVLMASEDENADLFWALRGGGDNFGVVTSFEFQLHPVADIYAGIFLYELDSAADLLRFFRDFIPGAPEAYGAFPASRSRRRRSSSRPTVWATPCAPPSRVGPGRSRRARRPWSRSAISPVVAELAGPMPYPALNTAFDPMFPKGIHSYWKGSFVTSVPDAAIEQHVIHGATGARGQRHHSPVPDQRRLPPGRRRRRRVRLPGRHLRPGDRGGLAGPGTRRGPHPLGPRLPRGDRALRRGGRLRQLHGRR